ncbi:MAG: molecular chaperone DnaJ [Novosphingobium sp.]|nr:molecular chaperone DnaJ [Novosphingobium sp.]MBO9603381.1 molecular chaperone DnaJ [Novosphingobium sp.]
MMRLLFFAAVLSFGCKYFLGRWPWDFLRPPPTRAQAVFRARKLLAVPAGAGRAEILDAHRKLIAVVHPDRGGTNSLVHEANAARDLLLDELPDGN